MTWAEGVNEAHGDMATTQAALKGAARRLELEKQRRASADDAPATVVLTSSLFTHDGTAADLRADAEEGGGSVDRPGDCTRDRIISETRKQSGLHAPTPFKETRVLVLFGTGTWRSSWRLRQYGPDTV